MNRNQVLAGVLFNSFEPIPFLQEESISERAVETAAAQAAEALSACGYRTVLIPLRKSLTGLVERLNKYRPDVLVNLCEGFRGLPAFESQMAGFLELLQIPFTGNPSRSLSLCQDKFCTKSVLAAHGLPVPQGWVVEKGDPIPTDLAFPLIVKPNEQDASLGIYPQSVVEDRASLAKRVEFVSERYGGPVLVESFIDGREFNVAVLDGRETRALPVSEIEFRDLPAGMPRILGYHAKWQEDHELYQRTVPVCPAAVSSETAGALQRTALAAYRALKLKGYARVDFRMDAAGKIHILEVNPNPDASRDSGIARALKAAGIKYEEFWDTQVLLALNSRGGLP